MILGRISRRERKRRTLGSGGGGCWQLQLFLFREILVYL